MSIFKTIAGHFLDWTGVANVPAALPALSKLQGAVGKFITITAVDGNGVAIGFEAADKPGYTSDEVGADPSGTAARAVSNHNSSEESHPDIRELIDDLTAGKLDADQLQSAIDAALAQAQASGQFDGEDGADGITPHIGDNGNWYIGTADTGVAARGQNGRGIQSIARTSGTGAAGTTDTYTITYTDGTTSTLTVYNGRDGENGEDGAAATLEITGVTALAYGATPTVTEQEGSTAQARTYVLGIPAGKPGENYVLTEEDRAQIAALVIEDLGGRPVYGYVEESTKSVVLLNAPTDGYVFYYELADGSRVEIGVPVEDTDTYYSVTNTLTNCTSSNSEVQVVEGGSYATTITADDGYELESVVVTMGGVDITETAYADGVITIAEVTGNIVITAVVVEAEAGPAYTNQIPISTNADGSLFVGPNGEAGYKTGYRIRMSNGEESALSNIECTGFMPCKYNSTLYIKGITIVADKDNTNEGIAFYNAAHEFLTGTTSGFTFGNPSGEVASKSIKNMINYWPTDIAYVRFSAAVITADSIFTVDEPIE